MGPDDEDTAIFELDTSAASKHLYQDIPASNKPQSETVTHQAEPQPVTPESKPALKQFVPGVFSPHNASVNSANNMPQTEMVTRKADPQPVTHELEAASKHLYQDTFSQTKALVKYNNNKPHAQILTRQTEPEPVTLHAESKPVTLQAKPKSMTHETELESVTETESVKKHNEPLSTILQAELESRTKHEPVLTVLHEDLADTESVNKTEPLPLTKQTKFESNPNSENVAANISTEADTGIDTDSMLQAQFCVPGIPVYYNCTATIPRLWVSETVVYLSMFCPRQTRDAT